MSKAKGKSGIGKGTDKKGWDRWQASARRAKNFKPYASIGIKKEDGAKSTSKGDESKM